MSYPAFADIARTFAPGWFAAVMGTGVLALTTRSLGQQWPLLVPLAETLHWFNSLLFIVLAVPWLTRWLRFRPAAMQTMMHPIQANFYPTFSIALLVLAAQWLVFTPWVGVALALWWLSVVLHFVFSFAVLFLMFRGEHVAVDHVTPAKFIPAVGLVVIPLAGAPLLPYMDGALREWALTINAIGLGAGSMLYLGLLGITLFRSYMARPAFGILTPTVWIHLAPIGVIPVSLMNLLEQLPFPVAREPALVLMLLVWGLGVWWLGMASLLTLAARGWPVALRAVVVGLHLSARGVRRRKPAPDQHARLEQCLRLRHRRLAAVLLPLGGDAGQDGARSGQRLHLPAPSLSRA
jgi:C4-dicarboxylate transporter/malic acid transport protein